MSNDEMVICNHKDRCKEAVNCGGAVPHSPDNCECSKCPKNKAAKCVPVNSEWEKSFDDKFVIADTFGSFVDSAIDEDEIKDFIKSLLQAKQDEIVGEVLPKINKFIKKVETGRARSRETYSDMKEIVNYFKKLELSE